MPLIGQLAFAHLFTKYFISPYKRFGEALYNIIHLPDGGLRSFYIFECLAMIALAGLAFRMPESAIPFSFLEFPDQINHLLKRQTILMLLERALYITTLAAAWLVMAALHMYIYITMTELRYGSGNPDLGDFQNLILLTLDAMREEKMPIAQAERSPDFLIAYQTLVDSQEPGLAHGMQKLVREGYTQLYETPPPRSLVHAVLLLNHDHVNERVRAVVNRPAL